MSRIRSKDTKPELLVRSLLHKRGYRFRLHRKDLPGKPDIVLTKYKTVIFVHGCFWHGHNKCKDFIIPKTNTVWWVKKIKRNKQVDTRNIALLKKSGWKTLVVYECRLTKKKVENTINGLVNKLY
jgi:DNA mismatch endonuclease (patch repair protein)